MKAAKAEAEKRKIKERNRRIYKKIIEKEAKRS